MILCLGTTLAVQRTMVFDRVEIDSVNRALEVMETASSKSVNVARVIKTIGEEPLCTGFLGGDTGQFMRRDLDQAKIAHDYVEVAPRTRTCVTVVDQTAGTATELIEEAKAVEPAAWEQLRQAVRRLLPRVSVMVMSGTLPPGGPDGFYGECVQMAAAAQVPAIVDGKGDPLRLALPHRPFVIKPNRAELAATVGLEIDSEQSLHAAMRKAIEQGARWAVVTHGKEAVFISDGAAMWRIDIPQVKVVNAIGSGDSFAAGLATGLARGQDVPAASLLGCACAVANTLTPIAGYVQPADVERILAQVKLSKI